MAETPQSPGIERREIITLLIKQLQVLELDYKQNPIDNPKEQRQVIQIINSGELNLRNIGGLNTTEEKKGNTIAVGHDYVGRDKIERDNVEVGGDQVGRDKIEETNLTITEAFSKLQKSLDAIPDSVEKTIATMAVGQLEQEGKKLKQVNEEKVEKWFNTLIDVAPDIGEIAVNTFLSPVSGLSSVFQKVAKIIKNRLSN